MISVGIYSSKLSALIARVSFLFLYFIVKHLIVLSTIEQPLNQIIVTRDLYLKGTTSRGFELLHYVLFKTKDHTHLISTMQEQFSMP